MVQRPAIPVVHSIQNVYFWLVRPTDLKLTDPWIENARYYRYLEKSNFFRNFCIDLTKFFILWPPIVTGRLFKLWFQHPVVRPTDPRKKFELFRNLCIDLTKFFILWSPKTLNFLGICAWIWRNFSFCGLQDSRLGSASGGCLPKSWSQLQVIRPTDRRKEIELFQELLQRFDEFFDFVASKTPG